ncbi:phage/plasmid primase-like protein [Klebsormidium nitens]|uniref:Phage/plasmid primase-like protein n=1 Tax=Klebsormidium nitens TaxID=105231 RepID=A0A1Y1HN81_KLENI|nr:phage/plasmid primase-like protein [Klebsormidium nitens]|eukprot:GAQ79182.1 phage/plasmid primase-like protein [Klebsormidium nitens]
MTNWLIDILNRSDAAVGTIAVLSKRVSAHQPPTDVAGVFGEEPDAAVLQQIKSCLAACGDSTSRFDKRKGNLYVFRVQGERTCPYGHQHQGSNNFCVQVKGSRLEYVCNSPECTIIRPRKQIGVLSCAQGEASVKPVDADRDEAIYGCVTKELVDFWAFQGDKGGSRIFSYMCSFCKRIVNTPAGFFIWTGKVYEKALDVQVLYILMHQLSTVIDRVRNDLQKELKRATDKGKVAEIERRLRQLRDYNNRRAAEDTLRVTKGEMFSSTFLNELDSDPNILNVNNGVIDLRTGKLDIHRPQYMCSKLANTYYRGLDLPSPRIDDFFNDVFNGDEEVIWTLQLVLGYGVTGSVACEKIVFLVGLGGNGKGVTKEMLEKTFGPYCGVMSKDVVVKTAGQRPVSKGAPTPHMHAPKGLRLSITDETAEEEELDAASVKATTGGGLISARAPYGQTETFPLMNLPVLMTNHPPKFQDVTDPAINRRLLVFDFPNLYVSREKFDSNNSRHRPLDGGLKARMQEEETLEQLLSWLVRGAVKFSGQGMSLGVVPPSVAVNLDQYLAKNDKLQQFIDEHCKRGPALRGNAAGFLNDYKAASGELTISVESLADRMAKKGFIKKKRESIDDFGKRPQVFVAIESHYEAE